MKTFSLTKDRQYALVLLSAAPALVEAIENNEVKIENRRMLKILKELSEEYIKIVNNLNKLDKEKIKKVIKKMDMEGRFKKKNDELDLLFYGYASIYFAMCSFKKMERLVKKCKGALYWIKYYLVKRYHTSVRPELEFRLKAMFVKVFEWMLEEGFVEMDKLKRTAAKLERG